MLVLDVVDDDEVPFDVSQCQLGLGLVDVD